MKALISFHQNLKRIFDQHLGSANFYGLGIFVKLDVEE